MACTPWGHLVDKEQAASITQGLAHSAFPAFGGTHTVSLDFGPITPKSGSVVSPKIGEDE
jgi:hypothetical protein